jgi:hypothetical protein
MTPKHLGAGTFPDVAYFLGRWYCAFQNGAQLHLVSLLPGTLEEMTWNSWTVGEPGVFPRLLSWQGRLFLAHKDGTANYRIALREIGSSFVEYLDVEATPEPDQGHGADPVALGAGYVAWQSTGAPDYQIWRKPLVGSATARFVRNGRPTGLSRVFADGSVTLVDEDREVDGFPGTRLCWAGDLTMAEGKNLGAYARLTDGRELVLWPGQEAVTPRCATDGADRYGIVTWGAREGVRFAEVTRAEFAIPNQQPQPERLPEGTEIDLFPFIVGKAETWPRDGSHPLHQTWDGRNLHLIKFGNPDSWERWILDAEGQQFYLREDRSQSGAGCYSFHPGVWFRRRMRVGEWIDVPDNVLQRYDPKTCEVIDQHPLPYRVGLIEAWRNEDIGGSLGVRHTVTLGYDPGTRNDTEERYRCADGAGLFQWMVREQHAPFAQHTTTFTERGGQALTPTKGCWRQDRVQWPPSTPKPPDPKPEPPTPIPVPKPEPVMSEVSLQTFNRSNWIVAEDGGGKEGESTHGRPTGLARADRSNAGPWETFSFKRGADGRVGFRAPNGGWLSAQPDGTLVFNRHRPEDFTPDGWEGFRVEGALDGGVSFVTDHGTRVRAVNTGGSELRHDVRESAGIDETFFPSVSLTTGAPVGGGHPVGGGAGVPGRLGVAGRWFASPAGLYDYREVSAFALYSLWLQKRFGEVDAFLSSVAPYANALRVLLTLDGDFWNGRGYHCGPDMPGFYDELRPFLAHCESRGFYVRLCLVGAVEPFGGVWFPDRRDIWTEDLDARVRAYIEQVMPRISDAPNVLTEGANEPGQIGLRSSFDRVKGWGRLAKRLAPHLLHNFAAVDGPNDGDTSFVEAPADFVDAHIHRMKEYHSGDGWNGWLWVKRSSEHAVLDNERMPAMSGETINFGSSGVGGGGDAERSPAIAMAYGATSRLRRYIANFHFDDGLWCLPPNAETIACLEGWKRGLDAIPMDFGGGWCNGHHGCSPWETSNFPSSDEVRDHRGPVRIFGRSGGGGYIGASIREVAGHRPTARRPVEEITRLEWGGYACAVYRA